MKLSKEGELRNQLGLLISRIERYKDSWRVGLENIGCNELYNQADKVAVSLYKLTSLKK